MPIQGGTHRLGPDNGTLIVKTYRQGLASKAGHDLVLRAARWEATLGVDDQGGTSVQLSADPASLEVLEGHHGVKPLSDKDRGEIRKNIDKKVLGKDPIGFSGTGPAGAGGRIPISGELTMAGATRPITIDLEAGAGRLRAATTLTQSEWGIKPFTGLMGALKVRDEVELEVEAAIPA